MKMFKPGWLLTSLLLTIAVSAEQMPTHNPFKRPVFDQPGAFVAPGRTQAAADVLPVVGATLAGGNTPLAIIEGKVLGIGEKINGYVLVSIQEGMAVFEHNGKRHEIAVSSAESENNDKDPANAND